jgi:hypothetical protein
MRTIAVAAATAALVWGGAAPAHGPEIDYEHGEIVFAGHDHHHVFVLHEDLTFNFVNLGWQSVHGGGNLVVGDRIGLEILDGGPLFGLGESQFLFYHNGTSVADPGASSLSFLGTLTSVSKSSAPNPNVALDAVGLDAGEPTFHAHLSVLLSPGSPPGAYAFWARMTTSNPHVQPSDPYLIVLNQGLDEETFHDAVHDFVEMAVIPEASSASLAAVGVLICGGLAAARRRRTASVATT